MTDGRPVPEPSPEPARDTPATPARQKGRPNLQEAAEIDRAIRDAALAMLLEHGEAATLNAVAQAAGLSRKTVYARYPGKNELFIAVIGDLMASSDGVEPPADGPFAQRLTTYLQSSLEMVGNPRARAIQRLLMLNPAYIRALRGEMIEASQRHFHAPLRQLLTAAVASGEIAAINVEVAMQMLVSAIFTHGMEAGGDSAGYAESLAQVILGGLLPRR